MNPFYRYIKLSDECQCGSGHTYKDCCFHPDFWGYVGAVALITITLLLPTGSWALRVLWGIVGVAFWFFVLQRIGEWFVKRCSKAKQLR